MMRLTLYSRAMLWIGASLAVVTALWTLLSVGERQSALTQDLHSRLVEAAEQRAIAVSDALWKLNEEGVAVVLQGVARDPDFHAARIRDETGRLFASVEGVGSGDRTIERAQVPITLRENGGGTRTIGTLILEFSHARIESMRRQLLWDTVRLGLLQLLSVLLATALTLRAVIKPLESITNRMLSLAGGDLGSPIPFRDRRDQLGDIACAVAVFGQEMEARRRASEQLEAARQDLERRVEERTRDLRESERRFHSLFDHSPLAKWVYSTATLRFLEVNDAAMSMYGYAREEFLSMTLMDIRSPEEADRLTRWMRESPPIDRLRATGWRHRRKSGQELDVEVHLSDVEFGGEPARLAVVIDVTESRKAERLSQRIFETSQDIILVTNGYGKVLEVSPSSAKVLGYQPEEMVGHIADDFIFPDDLEPTRAEMRAARRGSATRNFRCRYVHKDGRVVPLVWMATWSGQDRRHFFMGRDMTDYDRTEEQLRQSQKMDAVGQLTGGVAHDFNNILMVILANVEALEEEAALDDYVRTRVGGIGRAVTRAADLTRQLLAFSRKQPLRPKRIDINDLAADTRTLLRRTLGERIEIESILADDLWHVEVDPAQLEAALVNLSINARDAMPDGGRLLIETQNVTLDGSYVEMNPDVTAGDYVLLAVSDTGTGMPPKIVARAFEPFFTTKAMGKGTGLGLSMVYGFIKQSNGHVKIYSEVGHGTTIKLYLPRSVQDETKTKIRPVVQMPRGNETILVVEDDDQVRTSVVAQLRSLGYSTSDAPDGAAGLAACEASPEPFDLLLTDVIMPGLLNGRDLAREVARRWPETKLAFMSGYTADAIGDHGGLDPGVLLLSKPFRKRDLAYIVRQALDGTTGE